MRTVVFILLAACSSGDSAGSVQANPQEVVAERPSAEPPAPAVPSSPRPSPGLVRELARSDAALSEHVDPARGVVFVEYAGDASGEDPRADEGGIIKSAEHLCGDALRARLERLRRDLARRVETTSHDPLFTCHEEACTFPAEMEYDLAGELRFRAHPARGPVLDSVVRIEGGPVTDAFVAEARRWAEARLAELTSRTCPPHP